MTGILTNAGIIANGKVTEAAWKKYIKDVKEAMKSGKTPLDSLDLTCDEKLEPTPGAELLNLEDEFIFPDFHAIWRPRYENMALALDVEGDKKLAPAIFDPSAAATDLGANVKSPPSLPEAIAQIVATSAAGGAPASLMPLLAKYKDDLPDDVSKDLTNPITFASNILPKVIPNPVPPLPKVNVPDTSMKDIYTDKYKAEVVMGISPLTAHKSIMLGLASPGDVVDVVTNLPKSLIEKVCKAVGDANPKAKKDGAGPMDTSSTEKAAQQVLNQHQVKFQCLVSLGTTLGNGSFVKALAATTTDAGGMGAVEDEPPPPPQKPFVGSVPTGLCPQNLISFHTNAGAKMLKHAALNIYPGRELTDVEFQFALGVGYHEGRYGTSNPSNMNNLVKVGQSGPFKFLNWGGVQCGAIRPPGTECLSAKDFLPSGKPFSVSFVAYPSSEEGAADMLRNILKYRELTGKLLAQGAAENDEPGKKVDKATFYRVLYVMRREKYFGGFCEEAKLKYGAAVVNQSLQFPDSDEGCKACAKEAVEGYFKAIMVGLNQALASNCLNMPFAMPMGTYRDAHAWYQKKFLNRDV
jgi:hypothetical protein